MEQTIFIGGHGPGISHAVARRFGRQGFRVALVARNRQRLEQAVMALTADNITAHAFPADLSDGDSVQHVVAEVRATLGPIGILHWNAFRGLKGDILSRSPSDLSRSFDTRVSGYIAAVQAALDDLVSLQGTVLATSGVMALDDAVLDELSAGRAAMAVAVAAQHKATSALAHTLSPRGIHVGEVIVNGFVAGTPGDVGQPGAVAPADVAERFWTIHRQRQTHSVIHGQAFPLSPPRGNS